MTSVYMNEWERFPANWLRALYPDATVDERSIADVRADDIAGHGRCHFFAGIGGWEYALELAGWPAEWPVWTGSCPCQPFSAAGKGLGEADPRHLWPELRRLISECRPPVVFGEQVASRAGREWLAGVRADLEALGYAVGAADLCAAGVGAPHIRQRLYWVAYAERGSAERHGYALAGASSGMQGAPRERERLRDDGGDGRAVDCWLAYAACDRAGNDEPERVRGATAVSFAHRKNVGLVHANGATTQRLGPLGVPLEPEQEAGRSSDASPWSYYALVECADGKARRVEPGVCPLAHGVPGRVGQLRGYGNAIVPQVAAAFVKAFMEATCHA